AALPSWALGADDLAALLADPAARDRMRPHPSLLSTGNDWSRIVLFDNPFWPEYARRPLSEIAAERGQDPLDAVYDLLIPAAEDPNKVMVILNAYDEEEQRGASAPPGGVPGSAAPTMAPAGPLGEAFFHGAYTWASWFWRFMVNENRLLSPAAAVHK